MDWKEKLIEWLENLTTTVGNEIPGIVQEISTYGFYDGVIGAIVSFVLILFLVSVMIFCIRKKENKIGGLCVPTFFISFVLACTTTFILYCNINQAIKAYIAPRVYCIDYIRRL